MGRGATIVRQQPAGFHDGQIGGIEAPDGVFTVRGMAGLAHETRGFHEYG